MPKITHEREKCIGCGTCSAVCPKFWQMENDGKAKLLSGKEISSGIFEINVDNVDCAEAAAQACPAQVIKIEK